MNTLETQTLTFKSLILPQKFSAGSIIVWKRNFHYFKNTLLVSIFWVLFEPLLYLGAIGFGLGAYVNTISGVPYIDFFFPALLCSTSMLISFFESTYGSFSKLTHQNTFTTIALTPIEPEEIVLGEILWGAFKGFLSALGVVVVASFLGLVDPLRIWGVLAILALVCWCFSSIAMLVTSMAVNYDSFIYASSGFIIPMTLFSGTYFPLSGLPGWLQNISYALPLTHAVMAVRSLTLGQVSNIMILNILFLFILGLITQNLAVYRITKKILK